MLPYVFWVVESEYDHHFLQNFEQSSQNSNFWAKMAIFLQKIIFFTLTRVRVQIRTITNRKLIKKRIFSIKES